MCVLALLTVLCLAQPTDADSAKAPAAGLFANTLWFLQSWGMPSAEIARNDKAVKATVARALAKDAVVTFDEVQEFMSKESFEQVAGTEQRLTAVEIESAVQTRIPATRQELNVALRQHLDYLTTTFDMVEQEHRDRAATLAQWIVANYRDDQPLHAIVVCTGNSRRSILTASMGNAAAAYYGMDQLHFHSGGTAPTAFNKRTITALQAIGFDVQATGKEAQRGDPKTANPIYTVTWGVGYQTTEFSKRFNDTANPASKFAALMVCNEADVECPTVPGAALRLSMPFLDPKSYDDSQYEAAKYAERRDDIGRTIMSAMSQAALKLRHGK